MKIHKYIAYSYFHIFKAGINCNDVWPHKLRFCLTMVNITFPGIQQHEFPLYLFSESPVRVGVEAALLGLPRSFLGAVSSRPSVLCRLGVV